MRLIDADALKEEVNKKNVVGRFNTLLLIDNAPTVDVTVLCPVDFPTADDPYPCCSYKRPQGEWIARTDTEWHFECNQCKGLSPWKAQFCGVCGADMRKGGTK